MKLTRLAVVGLAAIALGAWSRVVEHEAVVEHEIIRQTIPRRARGGGGLWSMCYGVFLGMLENRLLAFAASIAFYALLALVPALSVAVSVYGLFGDPGRLADFPILLAKFLPADAVALVQDQARRLVEAPVRTLSIRLIISFVISLWSSSAAVRATFDALNVIDRDEETRSPFTFYATAVLSTIGALITFLVCLTVIGANPSFLALGRLSEDSVRLFALIRWPIFFIVSVVMLAGLYRLGPSRPPGRLIELFPGAAAAALGWALVSAGFSWYVQTLGNYSATYGSLAAVIVLMTWMWLSSSVVLIGAQLNAEIAYRRRRRLLS